MSKLLTECRPIKEVMDKPKKKKFVKSEGGVSPKYTLINEAAKKDVEELIRIYKESPLKARVKFYNKGKGYFNFNRLVLFEFENGDFEFSVFHVQFGISSTNRIYSSQKKVAAISYKKGKFWIKSQNKSIVPLTWANLTQFIGQYENTNSWDATKVRCSKIFKYFHSRFHWVMMLSECPVSWAITFNTVKDKELYGMNEVFRHIMKVPAPIAKMVIESNAFNHLKTMNTSGSLRPISMWKEVLKVLDHIEHITPEMLNHPLFNDTTLMARTLGRKVNCKWGPKRLKEEHDKWSLEITNTVLDCELEYDLNIRPIFKAFAEYSGYKLLSTNKDMLREGMLQKHCVGTYIQRVENGECAIFHIKGYTLQVQVVDMVESTMNYNGQRVYPNYLKNLFEKVNPIHKQALQNAQFRGRFNESAPEELVAEVEQMLIDFVNDNGFEKVRDGESSFKSVKRDYQHNYDLLPW